MTAQGRRAVGAAGRLLARGRGQRGSAVVEFVLVGTLLLVLFLGVVQLALLLYVRNTLVGAAAEGARVGAQADRAPGDGEQVTRALVASTLGRGYATRTRSGVETVDGVQTAYVEVRAAVPLVGLLGPRRLVVRGHALWEPR